MSLNELFAKQTTLRTEQTRVQEFLWDNNDGLKPEPERLAYLEVADQFRSYERSYCYLAPEERTQAVEAKRTRLRLLEENANEAYRVACLGGDAGRAYQLVLDELKHIEAAIIAVVRRR